MLRLFTPWNHSNMADVQEGAMTAMLFGRVRFLNVNTQSPHLNWPHKVQIYTSWFMQSVSSCRTRFALDCFSVRVIKYWNNLPNSVKYAPSVNAFKTGLDYLKSYNPDSRHGYWYLLKFLTEFLIRMTMLLILNRIQRLLCEDIFLVFNFLIIVIYITVRYKFL